MIEIAELPNVIKTNSKANILLQEMLTEKRGEIKPKLDPLNEHGFFFPDIEGSLKLSTDEIVNMLESLVADKILSKTQWGTVLSCPFCGSSNLKSKQGCPNCGSDKISRGRILEHFYCGNVKPEEEYIDNGKYICPKCKKEVKYLGTDYRSIGVKNYCFDCENIFDEPAPLRECMKCGKLFFENDAKQTETYSYMLDDEQRCRLQFDFTYKRKFMDFLTKKGYSVIENAMVRGASKSGAEFNFDLLATRYDGVIQYNICIDILINSKGEEIGLDEVFKFDSKTYDLGIHDRILLVVPGLNDKARKFTGKQHILVLKESDIDNIVDALPEPTTLKSADKQFKFSDESQLLQYLKDHGYSVEEDARIKGRSGVNHVIDIYAYLYDGVISHSIDIGILNSDREIGIDPVFLFDTKAYDIGVHDKILLVNPKLSTEARQFAQHQHIRVYELGS
jgi:hypothetical protein